MDAQTKAPRSTVNGQAARYWCCLSTLAVYCTTSLLPPSFMGTARCLVPRQSNVAWPLTRHSAAEEDCRQERCDGRITRIAGSNTHYQCLQIVW